jgi:hypothetical protein
MDMTLTPDQAADSLKQIERTQARSAQARIYANASPGFILWGLIWIAGYLGSDALLRQGDHRLINWLWTGLTVIGAAGSAIIGRRQHRNEPRNSILGLRWGATFVALGLFVTATFLILKPASPAAAGAFYPLLVALAYTIFGIWNGPRFLFAGLAVAAATVGGYFFLPQYFLVWMAFVGGGALILAGLWLRRV